MGYDEGFRSSSESSDISREDGTIGRSTVAPWDFRESMNNASMVLCAIVICETTSIKSEGDR
jgi:hypothetical protein